jgi:hypothetical protein
MQSFVGRPLCRLAAFSLHLSRPTVVALLLAGLLLLRLFALLARFLLGKLVRIVIKPESAA